MMKALPVPPIDGILIHELQVYLDGKLYVTIQRFPSCAMFNVELNR